MTIVVDNHQNFARQLSPSVSTPHKLLLASPKDSKVWRFRCISKSFYELRRLSGALRQRASLEYTEVCQSQELLKCQTLCAGRSLNGHTNIVYEGRAPQVGSVVFGLSVSLRLGIFSTGWDRCWISGPFSAGASLISTNRIRDVGFQCFAHQKKQQLSGTLRSLQLRAAPRTILVECKYERKYD